ncbi:unnamed protein product, partial [Callosobruchus maculatus]
TQRRNEYEIGVTGRAAILYNVFIISGTGTGRSKSFLENKTYFEVHDKELGNAEMSKKKKPKATDESLTSSLGFTQMCSLENNSKSIAELLKENEELKEIIQQNQQIQQEMDIIILTECWKIENPSLFGIKDYSIVYNYGTVNQNDGVLLYVKKGFPYTYKIIDMSGIKVIEVSVGFLNSHIIITAIYRPPSTCVRTYINDLCDYLNTEKNFPHILIGDINIDILGNSDISHHYLNTLGVYGFESYINKYTRIQGEAKSCIDHIFVREPKQLFQYNPILVEENISDHYPTVLQILSRENIKATKSERLKQFVDNNKLLKNTANESWSGVYMADNLETATNIFIHKFKAIIENSTNTIKMKRNEIKRNPWVTKKVLKLINEKNDMHKLSKKYPTEENIAKYKDQKNKVETAIKAAKKEYCQNKIRSANGDSSVLWKTVKEFTDIRNTGNIKEIRAVDGNVINDPQKIANCFVEHFNSVGKTLAGPRSYNLIPDYMRHVQSIHLFKSMLKNWIASIPRYQVHQYIDVKNIYYANVVPVPTPVHK